MNLLVIIFVVAAVLIISSLYHGHIHQNSLTKYDILQEKQDQLHRNIHQQIQDMHEKQIHTMNQLQEHRDDTNRQFKDTYQNTIDYLNKQQESHQDQLSDITENVSDISNSIDEKAKTISDTLASHKENPSPVPDVVDTIEVPKPVDYRKRGNDTTVETHPNSYDFLRQQRVEMEDARVYGSHIKPFGGSCPYPYYFGSHNDYRPFVSKDLDFTEGFANFNRDDDENNDNSQDTRSSEPRGVADSTGYGDDGHFEMIRHHNNLKKHLTRANQAHTDLGNAIQNYNSKHSNRSNRSNQPEATSNQDTVRDSDNQTMDGNESRLKERTQGSSGQNIQQTRSTEGPAHMRNLLTPPPDTSTKHSETTRDSYNQHRKNIVNSEGDTEYPFRERATRAPTSTGEVILQ